MERNIIHVDMDAFFAAVEKRDDKSLKDKPVIVGGHPHRYPRGVVSTCCYTARRYGVKSAMSTYEALRRCPEGIFILPNHNKYLKASKEIMGLLEDFTPLIEPVSIDEAFLDVTGCERLLGDCNTIAYKIQHVIFEKTGLTCSVGVAPNKFLAKLASDLNKPRGITIIRESQIKQILEPLPVGKIWGVGPKQQQKLAKIGVKTIGDLRTISLEDLTKFFGLSGSKLWNLARGIDEREVITTSKIKSISNEETFMEDLKDNTTILKYILYLCDKVSRRLRKENLKGKTIMLKLKFSDFKIKTYQKTLDHYSNLYSDISSTATLLYKNSEIHKPSVRLIGVGVSSLCDETSTCQQLDFFENNVIKEKEKKLLCSIDEIKDKYGEKSLYRASQLQESRKD